MGDYTLGIKELDNEIKGIMKGTNILMIGPPMSQKEIILYNIMHYGATVNENAIITVTTHETGTQILDWLKKNKSAFPLSGIGIIDCITKLIGADAVENENIKIAGSPLDLTGIGVRIGQFFEYFRLKKDFKEIQVHLNSLSTILMYSNINTVFRFIHVYTGRIKAAGALGIFLMESGMHGEQAIATLKQLFDGMIEIKLENDVKYIRMVGLSSKSTPWFEYEIEGADLRILRKKNE